MTRIRIITSYRHKVGKLKDLKQWLDTSGDSDDRQRVRPQ